MKISYKLIYYGLAGLLMLTGCDGQRSAKETGLISLNLETMAANEVTVGLSDIAKEVRYIQLETLPDILLNPARIMYRNGNIIILNREGTVHLFNADGKFIRQIGNKGHGPGEYINAQYLDFSADGSLIHLYCTECQAIYTYNMEGVKVNSHQMSHGSWRAAPVGQGKHILISPYGAFSPDSLPFLFFLQDETGKVIRKYPSTRVIKFGGDFSIGSFYVTPQRVLAYQPFCDTVFNVDMDGHFEPAYCFGFGSHRAPDALYDDMSKTMVLEKDYFISPALVETSDRLFIRFKRLKKYQLGWYQFDNREILSVKTTLSRIPNDFDGGPDFWPSGSDGKKMVYQTVLPVDLLDPDKTKAADDMQIKNPKSRDAYQKMLKNLKEDDNPILMIVTLK